MSTHWAEENLKVIRTLMERSAVYRRALAPVMLLAGGVGLVAALAGWKLGIESPRDFLLYWMLVSIAPLAGSFLLVRRQALKAREAFWSPPTRRITRAMLPPLLAGMVTGLSLLANIHAADTRLVQTAALVWMPVGWTVLYGCALHAAGFFMPRGIKWLGWGFIGGGCALFALRGFGEACGPCAHGIMGMFFGGFHLAYGIYLCFTEKGPDAA
ncbi:MAG TPA: hypothetical protein VHH73_16965 [Verrucomicrobiae bacterium]|nr:hypothetical protein [Verrucomicrobiae bacterium]